ncbi:hypothetical protein [Prochlorococcus marinus]|uniref:hypothetical protein n=1 Tax=Prochlorococcus marinus TaxID=1219 RepID=UPI00059F954A|nr:hypothetical protein [Prochlorococcus marinus]
MTKPFIRSELYTYSNYQRLIDIQPKKLSRTDTNKIIFKFIKSHEPFMVGRFGWTEIDTLIHYENFLKMNSLEKLHEWSLTLRYPFSKNCLLNDIHRQSGFYPVTQKNIGLFREEMISSMKSVDLLASWVKGESKYQKYLPNAQVCKLDCIEPYLSNNPWSEALEGLKVLVVHPFTESIYDQYKQNRSNIFKDKKVLPKFELKLIKAPQTLPGDSYRFSNWFETLDALTEETCQTDFDIALIGCGAYGFPLASRIKKLGKKSIHLGGATQIMFGIKGKRWDQEPVFMNFYNEFWKYPSMNEKPKGYFGIDRGCYWDPNNDQ